MKDLNLYWRALITAEVGGKEFDKPSSGYSFSQVLDEERELAKGNVAGDNTSALLCLSIADPIWKMPKAAFAAGAAYFTHHPYATRYTDNFGVNICHEADIFANTQAQIAAYLNGAHRKGSVRFTEDWVQHSPGAIKRALAEYIPTALFGPKTILVFPAPGYGVIKDPKNNRGTAVIDVPMIPVAQVWDIDYDRIAKVLKGFTGNSFLYLNMPHNPTGTAYDCERWISVLDWAERTNVVLIVDEAYTHLRFGDSCSVLDVPGWESRCIVLQSVSKGWNATGLRFGWIVAHPTFIKAIRAVMDVKDSGLFGPSIAMGLWCLKNPLYTRKTCGRYRDLHEALASGLKKAGFGGLMPQAGLCQFTAAPYSAGDADFVAASACAKWFRQNLRLSLMHYTVNDHPYLRWAVTIKPVPDCGLPDELSVINEAVCRLQSVKFKF